MRRKPKTNYGKACRFVRVAEIRAARKRRALAILKGNQP